MSLIRTTIDLPFLRNGRPYGPVTLAAENPNGGAVFPSGRTYSGPVTATTDGSILATATVTRADDYSITITLTDVQVTEICGGLVFSRDQGVSSSACFLEIIRTDTTPDEQVGVILKLDVVK